MPAVEQSNAIEILLNGFAQFWALRVLIGGVLVVRVFFVVSAWVRLKRSGIEEIDRMDGRTFERRLAMLFAASVNSSSTSGGVPTMALISSSAETACAPLYY
jgi:hypothetical protein